MILLILFFLTLVANIIHDNWLYDNREKINHGKNILVFYLPLVSAVIISHFLFKGANYVNIFESISLIPTVFCIRWIFHDTMFNLLNNLKWDYIGTTANTDIILMFIYAQWDVHPMVTRMTCLIVSLLSYFISKFYLL